MPQKCTQLCGNSTPKVALTYVGIGWLKVHSIRWDGTEDPLPLRNPENIPRPHAPAPGNGAQMGEGIFDSARHNIGNLRPVVNLLREHNIPLANRREVIEAFTQNSRVVRLTEDRVVYRYWTEGFNGPRGRWVTSELIENPHSNLALPNGGPYQTQRWTIPAGTEVIEGLASPNFGMPGGGGQIYVPNPGVLR